MFREMRRKNQKLSAEETINVLLRGTSGVLAVHGDEGYPYSVPLSYVYNDEKIYFHSAINGHKLDALKANSKVSFCVIDKDEIVPEKFTTYFRSAIAFGKAYVVDDHKEKREILEMLGLKYSSDFRNKMDGEINGAFERVAIIVMEIEHLTGKQAIELMNM